MQSQMTVENHDIMRQDNEIQGTKRKCLSYNIR